MLDTCKNLKSRKMPQLFDSDRESHNMLIAIAFCTLSHCLSSSKQINEHLCSIKLFLMHILKFFLTETWTWNLCRSCWQTCKMLLKFFARFCYMTMQRIKMTNKICSVTLIVHWAVHTCSHVSSWHIVSSPILTHHCILIIEVQCNCKIKLFVWLHI